MSRLWQESWGEATGYWARHWRIGILPGSIVTLWIWLILLVDPAASPFVFLQIQPVNDPLVALTFHREMGALMREVPLMAAALLVTSVGGVFIVSRLLQRVSPKIRGASPPLWTGVLSWGFMLLMTSAAMGSFLAPVGGVAHPSVGSLVWHDVVAILILGFLVPWSFWWWPLKVSERPSFWVSLSQHPKEILFLPWVWLLMMAVIEMLASSFAWTTTVTQIGALIFALMSTASGFLHVSVAHYYTRSSQEQEHLKDDQSVFCG